MNEYKVTILGAGLAGCEAALWLAGKGVQVELYEQKPVHFSPAHKSEGFAELICSNSLKAERLDSASGLLKEEMRRMGSRLLTAAEETPMPSAPLSPAWWSSVRISPSTGSRWKPSMRALPFW